MKKKNTKYQPAKVKLLVKRGLSGLGLFAGESIPKKTCLIEYVGRVISREEEYTSKSKYLFEINSRKTIDGQARSNKARYINHSCRPNCEPEIYQGRVFIFSKKDIQKGEELSYDYGKEYYNEHLKPTGCRCPKCQEKIKRDASLPVRQK